MKKVEYRIERVPLEEEEPRTRQLLERLTELGEQGWHVASVDLTPHPAYESTPLPVLLWREVEA